LALEAVTQDGTNAATEEEKKDAADEMDALVKQQEIDIKVPLEEMKKRKDRVNAVDRLKREAVDRIKSKTAKLKLTLEAIPDAREIKEMDDDISQLKLDWAAMETDLKQCDVKICVLGEMMSEEKERLEISLNNMREEVLNSSRRPRKKGTVRGVEDRNSGRNPRNGQLLQAVKLGMKLKNGSGELYISEDMAKEWGDNPQFLLEVLLWMQDRMVLYDTDEKQIESCPIARLLATMMGDMNLSYTGIPKRVSEGMNAFHLLQWSSKTVKTQVPKLLEVAGEAARSFTRKPTETIHECAARADDIIADVKYYLGLQGMAEEAAVLMCQTIRKRFMAGHSRFTLLAGKLLSLNESIDQMSHTVMSEIANTVVKYPTDLEGVGKVGRRRKNGGVNNGGENGGSNGWSVAGRNDRNNGGNNGRTNGGNNGGGRGGGRFGGNNGGRNGGYTGGYNGGDNGGSNGGQSAGKF
jgi:hypothetical protein